MREGKPAAQSSEQDIEDDQQDQHVERADRDAGAGQRGMSPPTEDQLRPVNPEIRQRGKDEAKEHRAPRQPGRTEVVRG